MLREIASWISTKSGFALGAKLQFGFREQGAPDRCVLVAFNGGGGTDEYISDRADQMVQVLSRAISYDDSHDDSMTIYDAIHGQKGITLPVLTSGSTYWVASVHAVNLPQYIGPDEKGRHEFSTNYIFRSKHA